MANIAYLFNTNILTSDRNTLNKALENDGTEYVCVAEGVNKLPVPWLLCFRSEDLQPCTVRFTRNFIEKVELPISVPCASVETAIENLSNSLHVFEALVSDKEVAREYWAAALAALEDLPLPYLTMDVLEVLLLNGAEEEAAALVSSLQNTDNALALIKQLSAFQGGIAPYPRHEFFSNPNLEDQGRKQNSAALDGCFSLPAYRMWYRATQSKESSPVVTKPKPWWKLW